MAQLSYSFFHTKNLLGTLGDQNPSRIESYLAEGNLPFGIGVVQGSSDGQVKLAVSAGLPIGVVLREHHNPNDQTEDVLSGVRVSVIRSGKVMVYATGAVTKEANAYMITAVGATQGQFTTTASGNLLVGKFSETTSGAGNVLVQLNT